MAYLNEATKTLTAQLRLKGGVAARTLTGNVTCSASTETFCFWDPGGSSRDVTLTAEETSEGLFHVFVNEADAAENLVIKNDAGSTIVTINQNEWAIVACSGSAWADVPMSALADYLATANTWTGVQTFTGARMTSATASAITTTRTLTVADSGGVFSVAKTTAYAITLPTPAQGIKFKFMVLDTGANAVTISNGSAHLYGAVHVNNTLTAMTGTTLTLASGGSVGDWVEFEGIDATHYLVTGACISAADITIA